MGRMKDVAIALEDMVSWSTDELVTAWFTSDDPVERYAAQHLVRNRAADMIDLCMKLHEYGEEHPEAMRRV